MSVGSANTRSRRASDDGRPNFLEALRGLFKTLELHGSSLRAVREQGGRAELFIGVFSNATVGFTLESSDMSGLQDLALDLSIEVYC